MDDLSLMSLDACLRTSDYPETDCCIMVDIKCLGWIPWRLGIGTDPALFWLVTTGLKCEICRISSLGMENMFEMLGNKLFNLSCPSLYTTYSAGHLSSSQHEC